MTYRKNSFCFTSIIELKKENNMRQIISLVAVVLFNAIMLHAQRDQTLFSESGIRLTGAWAGPTVAGTLVGEDIVRQTGTSFALEFNKNLLIGWSNTTVGYPNTVGGNIDFSYRGLFMNYSPGAYKAIHPTFGILGAGGRFGLEAASKTEKSDIWVAQPQLGVEFNVFRWFKVGLTGGYRLAFFVGDEFENVSSKDLSEPFAALNFKFGFSWGSF